MSKPHLFDLTAMAVDLHRSRTITAGQAVGLLAGMADTTDYMAGHLIREFEREAYGTDAERWTPREDDGWTPLREWDGKWKPAARPAPAAIGEDARAQVLQLAHSCLNDQISDTSAAMALRGLARQTTDEERWEVFEELMDAIALVNAVESGFTHWSELIPEATGTDRDGQALDAARTRVDLALDEIVGGA